MDNFDKLIKEAVESYEAPYDPQAWANVNAKLGNKGGKMKWILGSAAAVVLVTGTTYMALDKEEAVNTIPSDQIVVTENNSIQQTDNHSEIILTETSEEPVADTDQSSINSDANTQTSNPIVVNNNRPTDHNATSTSTNSVSNNSDNSNNNSQVNSTNPVVTNISTNPETVVRTNARFYADMNAACAGTEFIFTPEESNQQVLYVWDFGDGNYSNSKSATHTYNRAGTFTVSLSLKDTKTNKTLNKSSIEITVYPLPNVNFAWEQNNALIPTVHFINLTEDATSCNWEIKGERSSTENQFDYTFRKKGTYMVEMTTVNDLGCKATLQKPIEIKNDYNLLAPTAFTPDGDAKNDEFIPEALKIMDTEFTMVIYDKSGRVMYQTSDVNSPWNGMNSIDNSMCEGDAYIWKVQLKNKNGETEYYEGQVILLR